MINILIKILDRDDHEKDCSSRLLGTTISLDQYGINSLRGIMARVTIEDSLKNIKNADRFLLVHEAVKLAERCPIDAEHKPAVWALKAIAEGQYDLKKEEVSE